jgi:hypothetical protein
VCIHYIGYLLKSYKENPSLELPSSSWTSKAQKYDS